MSDDETHEAAVRRCIQLVHESGAALVAAGMTLEQGHMGLAVAYERAQERAMAALTARGASERDDG